MYASTVDFGLAFVANPTAGISPLAVIFDNQTPNLSAYNFQWDFGDGFIENNNASFVPHLYSFDGIWDVTLTATDAQGCVDQLVKPGYVFSTGGVSCTHSATIQQASPLAGCIEDNIVLTCYAANIGRNDTDVETWKNFLDMLFNNYGSLKVLACWFVH
jgi:PKD repeat protein